MIIFFFIPLEAKDIPDKLGMVWENLPLPKDLQNTTAEYKLI